MRPPLASRAIVVRRDALGLLARPPRRDDRARRAGPEAERDPERRASPVPCGRPWPCAKPFRSPAPKLMTFTSGLEAASSTRPESFSTRPTMSLAASSIASTRSSSRFVRSTEPFTSRSSGTVSSRIASIIIFVLSSTRNVFISTTHRNRTSRPQNAARTIRAMSPPVSARSGHGRSPPVSVVAGSARSLPVAAPRAGRGSSAGAVPGSRTSSPLPDGS